MATTDTTSAQIFLGLERFLIEFAQPSVIDDGRHVIPGYANDETLPVGDNEFIVYAPISARRHGTTIERWLPLDQIRWDEYHELVVQIDCYSSSPVKALSRIQGFERCIRTEAAVRFLEQYKLAPLYADDPRNLTGLMDGKYLPRWSVDLHFGYWGSSETVMEYFNAEEVDLINADVRFPPE
jgi:hypothetical protein